MCSQFTKARSLAPHELLTHSLTQPNCTDEQGRVTTTKRMLSKAVEPAGRNLPKSRVFLSFFFFFLIVLTPEEGANTDHSADMRFSASLRPKGL